ncbi:hypothetical protein FZEAL_9762 [Fusarium zealandicum]|uniref:RRM domain-containing protein n=1 Tax=Fusarium zealandicum TaxID=1053134 RepID=A0A8H4U8I1_9HYPO|nr:hypothetical protein FZEAL_9762 [Fusarium zealandicum]
MSKIYVGNLAWATTDESLRDTFSQFGEIRSAIVMKDRDTGRSRGFGFVEFTAEEHANNAVAQTDGQDLDGRNVRVNIAQRRQ